MSCTDLNNVAYQQHRHGRIQLAGGDFRVGLIFLLNTLTMDPTQLAQALEQLPHDTLLTEIPQVQNSIKHLLRSNREMREYDPEGKDDDLLAAISENETLIQRYEARIDLTLKVIRERLGEAAAREVGSNVDAFRQQYPTTSSSNGDDDGVFL